MCFLQESYKKFKFWNFWERPLYEIWEYAKSALAFHNVKGKQEK